MNRLQSVSALSLADASRIGILSEILRSEVVIWKGFRDESAKRVDFLDSPVMVVEYNNSSEGQANHPKQGTQDERKGTQLRRRNRNQHPLRRLPGRRTQRGHSSPVAARGLVGRRRPPLHASRGRLGCEFVSPVLRGEEGFLQLISVLAELTRRGARVNQSTGLHIHVGWVGDDAALARLVSLVANFEKAIFASTGTKHREQGRWCSGIQRYGEARAAVTASRAHRYHILNLNNLATGRRRTVEFRAFAGTLNEVKLIGYVRLCLGLVERALCAKRVTSFVAKSPVATSPIHRKGEGQTELTRLFYQLGWIKGRQPYTFGQVSCEGAPSLKTMKRELMRLAKKYDQQQ